MNEGKSYRLVQNITGVQPKIIINTLKWRKKIEGRGKRRPTTTPRQIKDTLNVTVNTVTVRRRLVDANLEGRSTRKVPLLTGRHGEIFCGTMRVKLFSLALVTAVCMFAEHRTQLTNRNSPQKQ